jgi:hypothetical protein
VVVVVCQVRLQAQVALVVVDIRPTQVLQVTLVHTHQLKASLVQQGEMLRLVQVVRVVVQARLLRQQCKVQVTLATEMSLD